MIRMSVMAAVLAMLFAVGCRNPKLDDAQLLVTPDEVKSVETGGYLMPGAGEADYVERAAAARAAYRQSLADLADYYRSVGNATKLQWAQLELKTFDQMVQYRYLSPAEVAPANLQSRDIIDAADVLYNKGRNLWSASGAWLILWDEAKMRESLGYFNQMISQYPTSDKIDDAAYYSGRIYEQLKNYELAAVYYQRAFQWNPLTQYPARYRAAVIMDQRLKMRNEALTLYRMAVEKESQFLDKDTMEKVTMRIYEMSKPRAELEVEASGTIDTQ